MSSSSYVVLEDVYVGEFALTALLLTTSATDDFTVADGGIANIHPLQLCRDDDKGVSLGCSHFCPLRLNSCTSVRSYCLLPNPFDTRRSHCMSSDRAARSCFTCMATTAPP